jgi:hypothetical protein
MGFTSWRRAGLSLSLGRTGPERGHATDGSSRRFSAWSRDRMDGHADARHYKAEIIRKS